MHCRTSKSAGGAGAGLYARRGGVRQLVALRSNIVEQWPGAVRKVGVGGWL